MERFQILHHILYRRSHINGLMLFPLCPLDRRINFPGSSLFPLLRCSSIVALFQERLLCETNMGTNQQITGNNLRSVRFCLLSIR